MIDRHHHRCLSLALLLGAFSALVQAQTQPPQYTGIYAFNGNIEGASPDTPALLAQGPDGLVYGTVPDFGNAGSGAWFQYAMSGAPTLFHMAGNSSLINGPLSPDTGLKSPHSGFMLGIDGSFYGSAQNVENQNYGAIFKMWGDTVTTVFAFVDGPGTGLNAGPTNPSAPPVQGLDGNLYGVTYENGSANSGWIYQVILSANGPAKLGWHFQLPSESHAPLFLANDGNLYGTYKNGSLSWGSTTSGVVASPNGSGGIFGIGTTGVVTWFYNLNPSSSAFTGGDGLSPVGPVMQAADGNLYGTASGGGVNGGGVVYRIGLNGTGYIPIHGFQTADGTAPMGGLVQGLDSNLYGLASQNGTLTTWEAMQGFIPEGTLFKLQTPNGANFTPLFTFFRASGANGTGPGANPQATPVLHTNGSIFGLTLEGGFKSNTNLPKGGLPEDTGEFFSWNDGLKPFVSVVGQRSAHVGDRITIIGQGFSTATGITFGGVAGPWVKFNPTIYNDTSMSVTIPQGAKNGVITVLEPSGNLSTTYNFTIMCSYPFCLPIHRF